MSSLQLLDEGFVGIVSQAAAGIKKSTKNVKMAIRRLQQGREGDCRSQAGVRFSKPSQRAGATTISAEWGAADVATREALYS